jgi:hypothetical protein
MAMTEDERITELEVQADDARRDLRDTVEQMRQKVETVVETELRPDRFVISNYPGAAVGISTAAGFLLGSIDLPIFEPIVLGLLLGFGAAKLVELNDVVKDGRNGTS